MDTLPEIRLLAGRRSTGLVLLLASGLFIGWAAISGNQGVYQEFVTLLILAWVGCAALQLRSAGGRLQEHL
jgi:hypothetical protein